MRVTIRSLAPELHYKILDEVAIPAPTQTHRDSLQDLLSTSLVCQDWLEHSRKLLFENVEIAGEESFGTLQKFVECKKRKDHLTQRLVLRDLDWDELDWEDVSALVRKLLKTSKKLHSLEVSGITDWRWSGPFLPSFENLKSLRIGENVPGNGQIDFAPIFPSLRHLFLACDSLANFSTATIISRPPDLTHLELDTLMASEMSPDAGSGHYYKPFAILFPHIQTATLHLAAPHENLQFLITLLHPTLFATNSCTSLQHLKISFSPSLENKTFHCFFHVLSAVSTKIKHLTILNPSPIIILALTQALPFPAWPLEPKQMYPGMKTVEELELLEFGCTQAEMFDMRPDTWQNKITSPGFALMYFTRMRGVRMKFSDRYLQMELLDLGD